MKIVHSNIGKALRAARLAQNLSQEEFDSVTGRTYISDIERGVKQPTIAKLDAIAAVMKLHPLTVLTLSYCDKGTQREVSNVMKRVSAELERLLAAQ